MSFQAGNPDEVARENPREDGSLNRQGNRPVDEYFSPDGALMYKNRRTDLSRIRFRRVTPPHLKQTLLQEACVGGSGTDPLGSSIEKR
jgi:hypothetical protein